MNCTSVFKLMPQKGEFIFKALLVFYFYKKNKEYISGTLFVCWFSVVECKWSDRVNVGIICSLSFVSADVKVASLSR